MESGMIVEKARCGKCRRSMPILLGFGTPGFFPVQATYQMYNQRLLHAGCQCRKCGTTYCYDCSNLESRCSCGAQDWREIQYLDPDFAASLPRASDRLGRSMQSGGSGFSVPMKHPALLLLAALGFYGLHTFGLLSEQIIPKEEHKVLGNILVCLPALAVFVAARKLSLSIWLSAVLALAGPAVVTWAYWFRP